MTEKAEELVAEARRWANGHPNRRSGELMRDLAEALAALTTGQGIDAPSVREAIGEVLADMGAVIEGMPVASDLAALTEITDAAIRAAVSPPSRTAKRTGYETVGHAVGEHSQTIRATAALTTPQEAAPVCAWCPLPARGDAWHNDGKLHPSCGQIGHGQGWVPPYLAPVAKPCGESDDDIRGRLSELLFTIYDHGTQPNALREADAIIAAFPVLSRDIAGEIEAEADESAGVMYTGGLRRAAEIVRNGR